MRHREFPFIKATLENLPAAPAGKRDLYYDSRSQHLALRVTDKGTKTFMVYRWANGRPLKRIIGQFPVLSIEQARITAQVIDAALVQGLDPLEAKRKERAELTLGALFDNYLENYAKERCETWEEMARTFKRNFGDWRNKKVSAIKKIDVQTRINKLGDGGQFPHKANRAHDDLRALMEWGLKKGLWSGENPCIGIDRFKTQSRERFISRDELASFCTALKKICQTEIQLTIRDYILLSLMTGARQSNVLEMKWEQIDFDFGLWRIPMTKHGESHTIPLTQFALQLLESRFQDRTSEWVFPGKKAGTHLAEPKATWKAVLNEAKLKDLRIHDLRRTLGSYMAIGNQSLQIIGKALGHKSMTSTQVYARLANDLVRQGMEKAQVEMLSAAGLIVAVPMSDAKSGESF